VLTLRWSFELNCLKSLTTEVPSSFATFQVDVLLFDWQPSRASL
jgi:hypothetical protein